MRANPQRNAASPSLSGMVWGLASNHVSIRRASRRLLRQHPRSFQNHTHTVAVIPARYASTRFPGKALADIAGRPMIEHVYRRAAVPHGRRRRARRHRRRAHCRGGADVSAATARLTEPTTRPAPTAWPKSPRTLDCDLVVNLQGDEPLIEPRRDRRRRSSRSETMPRSDDHRSASVPADARRGRRPERRESGDRSHGLRAVFLALADSVSAGRRRITGAGPYRHIGLYV